jgi:prevent-host-death family protein
MEKTIGAFEARRSLGKLIEEAFYKKDSFIIERSGRPMAVLVSIDDYQRWQRLAKDQVFAMIEAVQKRNAKVPSAELDRDIRDALKSLRLEARTEQKTKA